MVSANLSKTSLSRVVPDVYCKPYIPFRVWYVYISSYWSVEGFNGK